MSTHEVQPLRMIFHHPLPLPEESSSGSRVRPLHLLAAFRRLGYDVAVVAGDARQRQAALRNLQARVAVGERFAFAYVEPPNAPLLWLNRFQPHPLQDYQLWHWCRRQGIPVGLFYRDVHWRFPQYKVATTWRKRLITRPLYWLDWLSYYPLIDHLFLPSLAMAAHLPAPWPVARLSALPPGCSLAATGQPQVEGPSGVPNDETHAPLRLFYVGGVQPPLYDLRSMFAAVTKVPGVTLTVCCRAAEWAAVQAAYPSFDPAQIQIVHAHGAALAPYYAQADLFALFWQPDRYLDFAMPVKLFEALSYGLPLVTTAGTATARFVVSEEVGWAVAGMDAFCNLLARLRDDRSLLATRRRQVAAVRHQHTWQVRARTAAERLTQRQPLPTLARPNQHEGGDVWASNG